jgi:hypothetical protein
MSLCPKIYIFDVVSRNHQEKNKPAEGPLRKSLVLSWTYVLGALVAKRTFKKFSEESAKWSEAD